MKGSEEFKSAIKLQIDRINDVLKSKPKWTAYYQGLTINDIESLTTKIEKIRRNLKRSKVIWIICSSIFFILIGFPILNLYLKWGIEKFELYYLSISGMLAILHGVNMYGLLRILSNLEHKVYFLQLLENIED